MKRYLAFYIPSYYPGGGSCDLLGQFDDYSLAIKAIDEKHAKSKGKFTMSGNYRDASGEIYDCVQEKTVWEC